MESNIETMSNNISTSSNSYQINNKPSTITKEYMHSHLIEMLKSSDKLSNGHKLMSQLEKTPGFYLSLLSISLNCNNYFSSNMHVSLNAKEIISLTKMASSILLNYLTKNWNDENYILLQEKIEIYSILTANIENNDYFLKNFIAKLLGIIAAKEWPNSYEMLIKKVLNNLSETSNDSKQDIYLRIMIKILEECDDKISSMTCELIPIVIDVFKKSTKNQKNREKCLKIISIIMNKLSYADGTDPELVSKSLDYNKCNENCLSLFFSILTSNPKLLFDIKKYAIRTLDILIRDMPIYSSSFYFDIIEPAWKTLVVHMTLYTEKVIFNNELEYSESELVKIEEENHNYTRGYESEDEEESYGLEGLCLELIDLAIDLLERENVVKAVGDQLITLLLCLKGYSLMSNQTVSLWHHDPNLYITEEYNDENINTIRNKSVSLINDISKQVEDSILLNFISILLSELNNKTSDKDNNIFNSGEIDPDNYEEVLKLDDYSFLIPYFDKMNTNSDYILRRKEANLLILGSLSDCLLSLKEKNKISTNDQEQLVTFLFDIISSHCNYIDLNKDNKTNAYQKGMISIILGRALWCISRFISLFKDNSSFICKIFEGICMCLLDSYNKNDLSVQLAGIQALSQISEKLPNDICSLSNSYNIDANKLIENIFLKLLDIISNVSEDNVVIVIDCIIKLTKLNKDASLIVPLKASKQIISIYSENYNHPYLGSKLIDLIKLWCEDERSSKLMIHLFTPLAIHVFEDFYNNNLKEDSIKQNSNFEEVKKTVMTEHGDGDVGIKASLDMLPNLIDIITMLTKYCVLVNDKDNLRWISLVVNVLCDILIKSKDSQILIKGTDFLRFYVPMCKDLILERNQSNIIYNVITKMLHDIDLGESCLIYTGNLVSQYFYNISESLEKNILEIIVKRTFRLKMPSVVQSMVLVFSRLLILYPSEIFGFLTLFTIENRIGLKVLIDKWLLHQPLFRGKYFRNVSIKALTLLYSIKDPIIESLMVLGYDPSHSNASVEVNAPLKILSVLIRCLDNEIKQKLAKENAVTSSYINKTNDYSSAETDNMSDYYENNVVEGDYGNFSNNNDYNNNINKTINNDNNYNNNTNNVLDINTEEFLNLKDDNKAEEINSKLGFINKGKEGGLGNIEAGSEIYLSEMLGFDVNNIESDEDENVEDDLIFLKDINLDFNLKEYLFDFFNNFKKNNNDYITGCLKMLPSKDVDMFKSFNI